jgi:inhibitor of KinA sporulation pathway (predicted exonuclease)
MVEKLDLTFEGRQHAGLDDAKNVARIAKRMHEEGAVFCFNQWLGRRDGIIVENQNKAGTKGQKPSNNKRSRRRCKK